MLTPKGVEDDFRRQGDEVVVIDLNNLLEDRQHFWAFHEMLKRIKSKEFAVRGGNITKQFISDTRTWSFTIHCKCDPSYEPVFKNSRKEDSKYYDEFLVYEEENKP